MAENSRDARVIGRQILTYARVTSTNDLAREFAERGEPEGLVIRAEEQTAGRGRRRRHWLAPPNTSIQLSILLRPPRMARASTLTQFAALALAQTLRVELGLQPTLKWPNDVLLREKKCAGILVESSFEGDTLAYAIVGIGVNVNFSMRQFPELAPYATTIADEIGHDVERAALERALVAALDADYARVRAGENLLPEFRAQLSMLGRAVRAQTPEGIIQGVAEDIADDGALLLRMNEAIIPLHAGDVTIVKE